MEVCLLSWASGRFRAPAAPELLVSFVLVEPPQAWALDIQSGLIEFPWMGGVLLAASLWALWGGYPARLSVHTGGSPCFHARVHVGG